MNSHLMMRPEKDSDVIIGPFMEVDLTEAGISEMGSGWQYKWAKPRRILTTRMGCAVSRIFRELKVQWFSTFYPNRGQTNVKE